jgi:hypothetical protein
VSEKPTLHSGLLLGDKETTFVHAKALALTAVSAAG